MIYLLINGNAGNQFFQYSFARLLSEKTGDKLTIDFRPVMIGDGVHHAENVLRHFNVCQFTENLDGKYYPVQRFIYYVLYHIIPAGNSFKNRKKRRNIQYRYARLLEKVGVYFYDASDYYKYSFKAPFTKNKFVRGFFESEQYFSEISDLLKKEFTPIYPPKEKNKEMYSLITSSESVCVTVRRTDFCSEKLSGQYDVCDKAYFERGVEYIKSIYPSCKLFVFSDDIEWCRENFDFNIETYFESGDDPIWEKLRMMYSCKHFVISNSTFSWWAQYLSENPDKIVVAPSEWRRNEGVPIDIYCKNWVYINENGEKNTFHK